MITENYQFLKQYGVTDYETDKVKLFLDGIKNQTIQPKWK